MDLLFLGSSLNFSAQGGRGKEKNCRLAEKIAVGSEGEAEGGCGGNSASPEPKSRSGGINSAPATLLAKSRTQQKSFLFLLPPHQILVWGFRRKNRASANQKMRTKLFFGVASPAPERSSVRGKLRERRRGGFLSSVQSRFERGCINTLS